MSGRDTVSGPRVGWTSRGNSDSRGVSTTLGYVLALGITTVLITGLLISVGATVDDRRETTTREGLGVVGQRIAATLMDADRLAETGAETVVVGTSLPERVAGDGYRVTVASNASSSTITLESSGVDVTRTVQFVTRTPVADGTIGGGDLEVVLTDSGDLEVRAA